MNDSRYLSSDSGNLLARIVDTIPHMIWLARPDGATEHHNARIREYSGLAPADVRGNGWQRMVHQDDLPPTQAAWTHSIQTGEPFQIEYRLRRRDGAYRWHISRACLERIPDGDLVCWVGSCTDVEDLKHAKEAVVGGKALLACVVESAGEAIVSIDRHGKVLSWNPAAERLFGYQVHEILGQNVDLLSPLPERAGTREVIARHWSGEEIPAFEATRLRKDGSSVRVAVTPNAVRDAAGRIVALAATYRDVSERRAALEARERLASIVESSDDAIIAQSLDGTITDWNRAAERMYGFTAEEAVGRPISIIVPPERAGEAQANLARVARGERIEHHETVRVRKYGTPVELSLSVSPIRDADGRVIGAAKIARNVTERNRAAAQLRRTTDLLQAVANGVTDAVFVKDQDGKYLFCNPAAARFLGRPPEEVVGKADTDLLEPESARRVIAQGRRVMQSGQAQSEEETITAAGVTRTFLATKAPYLGESGQVIGVVGISHDITERKRLAAERDELLGRLQLQIERMPLAYMLLDADNKVTDWNAAAERVFGYTRAEALAVNPLDLVSPKCRSEVQAILRRIKAGDMTAHSVNENVTKDGRTITCEWYNTPLMSEGGQFVGHYCLAQDVSARREADVTLRLRDRAIQAVTQGILITDAKWPDNPIIYASPGFQRLTGYTAQEVLGKNCRFLRGKETDPTALDRIRSAVKRGEPCTVELLNYRKDGSPFWNELSISPVRDDLGRVTHFVGVQVDVTGRRQLEGQFRQAQKMEAVGQLAGGVAHDFNNLLTIINGYSEILLMGLPPDNPSRELVAEIYRAGERSASLTRQLLAFSRRQVLVPRILDLNGVVADTVKMLERIIGEDVRLSVVSAPGLWLVKADPGQFEQVLLNLAVNARDAMPTGGKLIIETANVTLDEAAVAAHPDARPGPHVLLSVSDSGCGMDRATQAHIFEPFFTTKPPGKGTGLGLATVYGIVKQSDGHIDIDSEVGVGTTFEIYLPAVRQESSAVHKKSSVHAPPHGTETILLVEDEDAIRALTRHVLAGCGYTVLEAANGEEATRLADRHDGPIHLIISDVVMPGVGGRIVAERVAARHPEVRVLFVSGYMDDAVVRHGVLQDKVNFLQKPFAPAILSAKVREILDEAS